MPRKPPKPPLTGLVEDDTPLIKDDTPLIEDDTPTGSHTPTLDNVLAHHLDPDTGILTVVLITGQKLRYTRQQVPPGLQDLLIPL
jgi:hypothetical protein